MGSVARRRQPHGTAITTGGGGGSGLAALGGYGANLTSTNINSNVWPFIDMMKSGTLSALPTGGTFNSDGWIVNAPQGSSCRFRIVFGLDANNGWFPPGDYKARSTSGWTLQFTNTSGVTNISAAATNIATCTVADLGSSGVYSTIMEVTATAPAAVGTYSLLNLQVYRGTAGDFSANEALLTAGEIFDPAFLADLAGIKCIRTKDWTGTDGTQRGILTYSELVQETGRSWQNQQGQAPNSGNTPYSVCAKLAKKLGCALFFNVSALSCNTGFTLSAATDRLTVAGTDQVTGSAQVLEINEGDQVCFGGYNGTAPVGVSIGVIYYAVNVVARVSTQISLTHGGAPIDFTVNFSADGLGNTLERIASETEYQTLYNSIVSEIFTAAPGITILPDVKNENWNTNPYGYRVCFDVMRLKAGSGGAGSGYGWGLMRLWKACDAFFPRAQIVRFASGQWDRFEAPGAGTELYTYTDATLYAGAKIVNLMDAHCCAGYTGPSLNGGHIWSQAHGQPDFNPELLANTDWASVYTFQVGEYVHMNTGINYRCIATNTNQAPPNASFWVQDITTGLTGTSAAATSWTDAQWLECMNYGNLLWASLLASYKSQGDALRTVSPALSFVTYETGPLTGLDGFTVTGSAAYSNRIKLWMTTSSYRDYFIDMVAKVFTANSIKLMTYYTAAGDWHSTDTRPIQYGLKRAHQLPETLATTYIKAITL